MNTGVSPEMATSTKSSVAWVRAKEKMEETRVRDRGSAIRQLYHRFRRDWVIRSERPGSAFAKAVQPFIVWDLLKMAFAALTVSGVWALMKRKG